MKKQEEKQQIIDLDAFDDEISLWKMVPCGQIGHSMLKTIVDSVHNSNAIFHSLLLAGSDGLTTTGISFLKALGCTAYHQIDACLLHDLYDLHLFLFGEKYDGYVISNIQDLPPTLKPRLVTILKEKQFKPYNYIQKSYEIFDVNNPVVVTTKNVKKVSRTIKSNVTHIVELESYTVQQLILIVVQRLLTSHISYQNETVLQSIVKYGKNNLEQSIRFLRCAIAVMQSNGGRQKLLVKDVERAARLNRLAGLDTDADIPF